MKSTSKMMIVVCALIFGLAAVPASAQFLYAGDSFGEFLRTIDPATGATDSMIQVTLAGFPVQQIKGLAAHPSTGELYGILRVPLPIDGGGGDFLLATIRPDTGVATLIGNLGDRFAGLAFDGGGTLWGVTGDGGTGVPSLFTINTSDASTTFFMELGNGTDGETIAYNSADGMMYHLSGWEEGEPPPEGDANIVFEKIDLGTMAITDILLSGATFVNGNGLAYDAMAGDFVFSAIIQPPDGVNEFGFGRISTQGLVSEVGFMDEYAGGMAFSDYVPVELMSFSVE